MWSKEKFVSTVFDSARLRTTEVAVLLNIHRVSISRWKNSPSAKPHKFLEPAIIGFVDRVAAAVSRGALPPPNDVKGVERLNFIRRAVGK